jgi:hypothetical protein
VANRDQNDEFDRRQRVGLKHYRFDFFAFFFFEAFLVVFFFAADFLVAAFFGIIFLATFLVFFTTFLAASLVAWAASAICSNTGFSSSIAPS